MNIKINLTNDEIKTLLDANKIKLPAHFQDNKNLFKAFLNFVNQNFNYLTFDILKDLMWNIVIVKNSKINIEKLSYNEILQYSDEKEIKWTMIDKL